MKSWSIVVLFVVVVFVMLVAVAAHVTRAPPRYARGGAQSTQSVQWVSPKSCFPPAMIAECQKLVQKIIHESREFGPASIEVRKKLGTEAARLSVKYGVPIDSDQVMAIFRMEIATLASMSGTRALRHAPEIVAARAQGRSVLDIAKKFRLPPMSVLRQLLLELGHSSSEVRALISDPELKHMPHDLAHEMPAILEADLGSNLNAGRIRQQSRAFEDALEEHFRKLGLQFRTEADLRRDPTSTLTPDFLFDEPVTINGHPVHWVDAKDYMMYGGRLVARSISRQAVKYTKAYGPGAMVFSKGVKCDQTVLEKNSGIAPPLLLDGSHLVR